MKMGLQYWSQHVAAAHQEKASMSAYAKKHGLARSTLYYWQRKFQSTTHARAGIRQTSAANSQTKFIALRAGDAEAVKTQPPFVCTLILAPAIRLEMAALPNPQWLAALGHATQGAR